MVTKPTFTQLELDHAVASERERIAGWHDAQVTIWRDTVRYQRNSGVHRTVVSGSEGVAIAHKDSASMIRNGADNGQAATGGGM